MTNDDLIFRSRLRLFARAGEVGVRRACRELGFHHSTYYRWKPFVLRHGLEILRPRERRAPRMPNQLPPFLEEKVVAFALGYPGMGPRRIAASLGQERWGGLRISHNGVQRVLRRHGLSTRRKRLSLIAGYAAPPEPERRPEPVRHIVAERPGSLVQLDCFHIGRLSGTKGRVWQYTATDAHSAFLWAELHVTPLNPSAEHTSALVRRVAADLARAGWKLDAVSTDKRLGVQVAPLPRGRDRARSPAPLHPRRAAPVQRLRRAGTADRARRVLAPELRALAGPQVHGTTARPRRLPGAVQLRARP